MSLSSLLQDDIPSKPPKEQWPFPRVKAVRTYTAAPARKSASDEVVDQGADCHDVARGHWIDGNLPTSVDQTDPLAGDGAEFLPIANPMSSYARYQKSRKSWGINAMGSLVVEVEAEDGTTGVGVTIGGEAGCIIVEDHLSRFVEGEDPRNFERIWDSMFRGSLNYGRKGLVLQCISAVDLALYDLVGKIRGEPVFMMLGGRCRDWLPVYSTTCRPDLAKKFGFCGAKIACPYGPSDGDLGFRKNLDYYRYWRHEVGPDFPLSLDCYMSLTVPYTVKLARALEGDGLKWIEEFLPPDDYDGYDEVRAAMRGCGSSVLLTTGEHEYSKFGFQRLLKHRCVDIIQPDITWLGGLTEARKVVAMAEAQGVMCIPHGSSVYSYHLQFAFRNCPVAEFINLSPMGDAIQPYFGGLFPDEPLPQGGFIELDERKGGFGVTLCKDSLVRPRAERPEGFSSAENFARNAKSEPRPEQSVMSF